MIGRGTPNTADKLGVVLHERVLRVVGGAGVTHMTWKYKKLSITPIPYLLKWQIHRIF